MKNLVLVITLALTSLVYAEGPLNPIKDPEAAAVKAVMKCMQKGQINNEVFNAYYKLAERGQIDANLAKTVSILIAKRPNDCRYINNLLQEVVELSTY